MSTVTITIDNKEIDVENGITILEAAKLMHINIPTLCYHPLQSVKANCRICLVEDMKSKELIAACSTKVRDGMSIKTNSKVVRETRKNILELILSNHHQDCLRCVKNKTCELQDLCEKFNISNTSLSESEVQAHPVDKYNPSIVRDYSKCIKCNRCVEACSEVQNVNILSRAYRGTDYEIIPKFDKQLHETECVFCGQCINVCPVGAIYEREYIDDVIDAINNEELHVIVQIAPAVRVSIGEEFGLDPGEITTGKIVASLKRLGFDKVFDTNFTADLTIIEEGNELLDRIKNNKSLPMITSCSPGWINYMESFGGDLLDHLSSCKSPQQMFGALTKTYYSEKIGIHPSKIYTVSIMPCTAKKYEANRTEMNSYGYIDVDAVLTTRELARLIKSSGINFNRIEDEEFDDPFGITTGAGAIFGATGGVMEAALRTVYEVLTEKALEKLEFESVRGLQGIKEAEVNINGQIIKVAVAHGLKNAGILVDEIRKGNSKYTFIEIMACPGGCIGGGGQPGSLDPDIRQKRINAIYRVDENMECRKSHENPAVQKLYKDFLIKPLGEKSHHLLHTSYRNRG